MAINKIQELTEFLASDLKKVDEIILQFSVGKSPLIKEISHHLIQSGGKRIRPILLILAAKMCSCKNAAFYDLAAAIELIHSATLLHDDVIDDSKARRGKSTANAIWNNKPSILVGDYLFSIAFQLMVSSNDIKILELLAKTSSIMADGEVMQLENSSNIEILEEKYFEIIFGKTAVLFSSATKSAAMISKVEPRKIQALQDFGKNLGMSFQIADDILDYSSDSKTLGKEVGDDFFEGKITLPIIKLYKAANSVEKTEIKAIFEENLLNEEKNHENFAKIMHFMQKYEILPLCQKIAQDFANSAIKNLSIFENSIYKEYLLEILNYSLNRKK